MTTTAEIIAIGDELTSGQRLDTNSQWISEQLGGIGIRILFHTTVADDIKSNIAAFHNAVRRADVVICTGGLGPTADDLTRQSIAEAIGVPLIQDDDALTTIKNMFSRRDREMPERNIVQALFPDGSHVIPNPHGTAPGIDLQVSVDDTSSRIFALPGVPAEMKEMWNETVFPRIVASLPGPPTITTHTRIKCFGIGESDLEQRLPDIIRRGRIPTVGITVSKATITLRITASGANPEECQAITQPTADTIHKILGDLVFGYDDDELQHVVARQLNKTSQTIAIQETATNGQLSQWLTELDDFDRLTVASILPAQRYEGEAAQTRITSDAMELRNSTHSDLAIIVGSIAPPCNENGIPTVHIALAHQDGVTHRLVNYAGHPDILVARTAKQGLDIIRHHLLSGELSGER